MDARGINLIVMGGSAGAVEALRAILSALPPRYDIPIALVLHVAPGRPSGLADVLSARCALDVCEPNDKQPLECGKVYIAPPDYHLLVERRRCLSLSVDEPVHFARPSIDVLFESAAEAFGPNLAAVLLSGGNDDGARGLDRVRNAGGLVFVQAPHSASARTMPEAALRFVDPDLVLEPARIGQRLAALPPASRAVTRQER